MSNYSALKSNVNLLGQLLGQTIKAAQGDAILAKVEQIRALSKASRSGDGQSRHELIDLLHQLTDAELLPVARAFNQFLNLANVAEQFHTISRQNEANNHPLLDSLNTIAASNVSADAVQQAIVNLKVDLVLTAHPTEITRRTLVNKHRELNDCLVALELDSLLPSEQAILLNRIEQLICQAWHTNEIRQQRPTPVDEAKWGFAVIENSLWQAVPDFLREFTDLVDHKFKFSLPLDYNPIVFTSWMGGDRDGNPFVTAKVTKEVLDLGRWMAINLYLRDIDKLSAELSMNQCDSELGELTGHAHEPYRFVISQLRDQLRETEHHLTAKIKGHSSDAKDIITSIDQLKQPLEACYRSLHHSKMGVIADGLLLDVLRRIHCFGLYLTKLDIRQDSDRHSQVFAELTDYLAIGDYNAWSEQQKQTFLLTELQSKRPLIPRNWQPSSDVQEVIDTCKVIAETSQERFGIYIISMARKASDVLAVHLLLKEAGCPYVLPVAPLFETLDDLNAGPAVIETLFNEPWYKNHVKNQQYVMIGYSDSAKDAGMMAAGWAQYEAMDKLVQFSEQQDIELILFHGRGGTVGRGGAPAAQALRSQPPGSLKSGLRVTEQGEMIRFTFGLPQVAQQSLSLYAGAVLENNLLPPPEPQAKWQEVMAVISAVSCEHYRAIVREHQDFVPYFRAATPEQELAQLPLGSRPAKRKANGGVESLRAIPWIFAWSQNRLMLPAWLGAAAGLVAAEKQFGPDVLAQMNKQWPFFRTRIEMLEMVFCKADTWLSEHYDHHLVPKELQPLGETLRSELTAAVELVRGYCQNGVLLAAQPWVQQSIELRNPYTDPLNVLQVELLRRARRESLAEGCEVNQALMITMAGIAAGMRNTG
ncbi:phosphoenolpyruvate carboxylase [Pseudoalteromonas tunicata]|uniref:Phosphoenolpyruvate carboxylase n=1 Tax=Pseudoalteromonas tunicata D2 TaxID=87626 RepID=A4C4L9_9GAMM|nr:phosphoenolpyruvate carboxylase [Pseudoalteromonas tunicata]ATC97019.1 phosphoenolpyruvate carboxylase [Pseudoalteromonas tunicata]AXT33139.1 phosphoenolpyruvate carboxylase [Pseudoalteromonas tunicata]EAR30501.1 phosphoenolpyruvate carboxylase [Pseudoalteromonas tunicata D2]